MGSAAGANQVPDLVEELKSLTAALRERGVPYALCGGLAMAVHGHERATVDIDLLITADDLESARRAVQDAGFRLSAEPMELAGGRVEIHRFTKLEPGWEEPLPVDLLLVTPELEGIWEQRRAFKWSGGTIWVLSRPGLKELKQLRGSAQDLADIERLERDAE